MKENDENRMKHLLKLALPPVGHAEPVRDLWPAMLRRMDEHPAAPPWLDWVLACGVAIFAVVFPTAVPVFLYYL